jgi:hypothetical protein
MSIASSRIMLRIACVLCALLSTGLRAPEAWAQAHWDLGAETAIEKRFLRDLPPEGTGDAGFGPLVRVTGHVAFFPLLRVGLYGAFELSPVSGGPLRTQVSGGLDLRLTPPLPLGLRDFRPFLFFGAGYMRTFTPGSALKIAGAEVTTKAASGGCLDVPLGLGATYRVRKPFEIGAVLGTRFAALCSGDTYPDAPKYPSVSPPESAVLPRAALGKDIFALSLGLLANFEF